MPVMLLGSEDYRRSRSAECGHGCYNYGRKRNRYKAWRRCEGAWRSGCYRCGKDGNRRSERQARGRAGRQGDPGFSQYYVSLEDDIVGAEDDEKLESTLMESDG